MIFLWKGIHDHYTNCNSQVEWKGTAIVTPPNGLECDMNFLPKKESMPKSSIQSSQGSTSPPPQHNPSVF
jgi:hypothetical protein